MKIPKAINDTPDVVGKTYQVRENAAGFDTIPGGGHIRIAVRVSKVSNEVLSAFEMSKRTIETKDHTGHNLPENESGRVCTIKRLNPDNVTIYVINQTTKEVFRIENECQIYLSSLGNGKVALVKPSIAFK